MIIDLLIVLVLGIGVLSGIKRGFITDIFHLTGIILVLVLSWRLYPFVQPLITHYLNVSKAVSLVMSFFMIFLLIGLSWNILSGLIIRLIPRVFKANRINHILGALPGFLYGLLYISIGAWFISHYSVAELQPFTDSSRLLLPLSRLVDGPLGDLEAQVQGIAQQFNLVKVSPATIGEIKDLKVSYSQLIVSPTAEQTLFKRTNEERTKLGLKPLAYSADLQNVARQHALDMWQRQYFSHTTPEGKSPFDRLSIAHILYISAGENLALAPTADLAHQGLMDSTGHRENILYSGFGKVGIGAIDGGKKAGIMFVQIFTN